MSRKIELYGCADSPYVARVQWMLEEQSQAYNWIETDLVKGEQNSDLYLSKFPTGQVPGLVVDGKPIFDSVAIIKFLSVTNNFKFYSEDLFEATDVDSWLSFSSNEVGEPISKLCWQRFWKKKITGESPDDSYVKRLSSQLDYNLPKLELRLSTRDYLCGEFSLADIASFPLIVLADRAEVDLNDFPSIKRWLNSIKKRPSLSRVNYSY